MRNLIATSAAILLALPVASQMLPDGTIFNPNPAPVTASGGGGSNLPTGTCYQQNMKCTVTFGNDTNSNWFATPFSATGAPIIQIAILSTSRSKGARAVELWSADAAGKPIAALRKGSVTVVGPAKTYAAPVFAPVATKAGQKFCVVTYLTAGQADLPGCKTGTKSIHYWHSKTATAWNGPFTSIAWSFAINCAAGAKKTVSPVGYAKVEGNSNNTFPWYATFNYMQGHGDLKSKPMLVKGQSHRRDGNLGNFSSAVARSTTCEIFVGESDFDKVTGTFATNWIGKPTSVFKGVVKQPDWVTKGPVVPAPFNFNIMYTTPAVYTGKQALTWQVVITAISATTSYPADAVSAGGSNMGTYTMLGKGCTASDQTRTMDLRCYFTTYGDQRVRHYCYCYGSFRDQVAVALMGFKNPNVALPLCAATPTMKLYTTGDFSFASQYAGKSRATDGYWNTGTTRFFKFIPGMEKIDVFHHAASSDPKAPYKVTLSNGVSSSIKAPPPPPPPIYRVYARGLPNATSGSLAKGYALVTEFTH